MDSIVYQKSVAVSGHYHAAVCGGGPAGWAAAVALARQGKKTALVERFGFLGGTAATGYVVPISGFYYEGKRVVGGIAYELVERMASVGKAQIELPRGHVSYDPEYLKLIAWDMAVEAGVDIYTNCYVSHCTHKDRRVSSIIFESKSGTEALTADFFVDATGDGDICHMLGVPMLEDGEGLQPMSLCFILGGVDLTTPLLKNHIHHDGVVCRRSMHTEIHDYLNGLAAQGVDVPQFGGPWFNTVMSGDLVAVNITRSAADATDRRQMTEAEGKMRNDAHRLLELLRERYPEFKQAYIAATAVQGGVRETRRIKGLHTLTAKEMISGTSYRDSIALSAHPMDIHSAGDNSQSLTQLPSAASIPFRSIIPEGVDNLVAVGRCMSADKAAHASVRVMATMMATGQAAGIALSLCNGSDKIHALDISELHRLMSQQGSIY